MHGWSESYYNYLSTCINYRLGFRELEAPAVIELRALDLYVYIYIYNIYIYNI